MTDYQKLRTLIEEELRDHEFDMPVYGGGVTVIREDADKLAASILRAIQPVIEETAWSTRMFE